MKLLGQEKGDIEPLVPETAVFNFSGESSSGKTSVRLASMSIAGASDRAGTLDFTRRGLAELANDHNDLPFATDDTENVEAGTGVLVGSLKSLVNMLPGGRSKKISKGVDPARFPELRWSTFGLSSSPLPISVLAAKCNWKMSPGHKVRLLDIGVPGPKKVAFSTVSQDPRQPREAKLEPRWPTPTRLFKPSRQHVSNLDSVPHGKGQVEAHLQTH